MKKLKLIHNPNLLLRFNIWCNTRWQIHMKNLLFENFNHLIVKDFWMIKIWLYFYKSKWIAIFICFSISLSQKQCFEKLYMGFCGFPFEDFQIKNVINYIKYKFSCLCCGYRVWSIFEADLFKADLVLLQQAWTGWR